MYEVHGNSLPKKYVQSLFTVCLQRDVDDYIQEGILKTDLDY